MALTREEVYEKVTLILEELVGGELPEGMDPDAPLTDSEEKGGIGADSLDLVEQIMELEDRFGKKISDEEAQGLGTLNKIVDFLVGKGVEQYIPPKPKQSRA